MTRLRFTRARKLLPAFLAAAVLPLFLDMVANNRSLAPGPMVQERSTDPAAPQSGPAIPLSSPVSVTLSPAPFPQISSNDQIIREFVVQNNTAAAIDVFIRLNFTSGWRDGSLYRSVSTRRQVPPRSRQVVSLFVPSGIPYTDNYEDFSSANPEIYVNGHRYRPLPTGIMNEVQVNRVVCKLPSTFTNQGILAETLAYTLRKTPAHPNVRHAWGNEINVFYSDSDTIQWPAIPQFYQAGDVFYRKTSDTFTADAETALNDAVMLGATEVLFVAPGTPWPEWAPRPQPPSVSVIVPRGFGRTLVVDESGLRGLPPTSAGGPNPQWGPQPDENQWKPVSGNSEDRDRETIERLNPFLFGAIPDASTVRAFNPAVIFLALPVVQVPAISFAVVIFALLAYILIVGPANYFYLIKKKKSVLLLLLTVPVISLIFVAVVIVFVALFEGWYSRASAVGVTFLDQTESRAYTRAAVNLYAPVPVRKFTFDTADTVSFASARDITSTLGRDQVITGPNRARIPLSYTVSRAEKRLEQLRVSRTADGAVSVMNGLGAPVKILALRDDSGRFWTSGDTKAAPGANLVLHPLENIPGPKPPAVSPQDVTTVLTIPRGGTLSLGKDPVWIDEDGDGEPDRFYDGETMDDLNICPTRNDLLLTMAGLLCQDRTGGGREYIEMRKIIGRNYFAEWARMELLRFKNALRENPAAAAPALDPGMYLAETDVPLFYTPGCKPVSFKVRHLIVGTFNLQESSHEN